MLLAQHDDWATVVVKCDNNVITSVLTMYESYNLIALSMTRQDLHFVSRIAKVESNRYRKRGLF